MRKIVSIIAIFLAIFIISFSINVYAAALGTVDVTTTKQTIRPGENVTINIEFGEELVAYTFDVAYDDNIFEYVSAVGGTPNDNGTRVRVYFFDTTGGTAPRSNMSVTFKAKSSITTTNPTNFSITANGLAKSNTITYDDITTPIVKNVTVEPAYKNYDIKLNYTGDIIKNVEKDMKLVVSSSMGKNYAHTRIVAEATTPTGATVKLLATDNARAEHDILTDGWGDTAGDPIGGKNVAKELNVRGLFSDAGSYAITFKLIDLDNANAEIAKKTVNLTVKEKAATVTPSDKNETTKPETSKPSTMPQTGNTIYLYIVPIMVLLVAAYVLLKKKD